MKKIAAFLAITASLTTLGSAQVTVTTSTTAPTVGADDIAQLTNDGTTNNNSSTAIWVDQPGQGQSFTTLGNTFGYSLDSITVYQNASSGNGNTGNLVLNLGTYNAGTFVATSTYTATTSASVGTPDYVTFTLATPVVLAANTSYAFDIGSTGAGMVLSSGTSASYTGGTAFSTDPVGGATPITSTSVNGFNREFDIALTANTAEVPEPSTWALMLGGLGMLGFVLRRKANCNS